MRGYHVAPGHIGGNNLGQLARVRRVSTGDATVICPKNYRVVAGGGDSVGGLETSQPVTGIRGGWFVATGNPAASVTAEAICLKRTPAPKKRRALRPVPS